MPPFENLLLDDERMAKFHGLLDERLAVIIESITADSFASLLDPQMRRVLDEGFARAHADEGTVWLIDSERENLIPVYNTGPAAWRFVGKFKQPVNSGLISMVFATERPFAESNIEMDPQHSKTLDLRLKVQTRAMIAVPLYFLRGCRGIVSCVQLSKPASSKVPRGFGHDDLEMAQHAAQILGRLIELRAISIALGRS